MAVVHAHFGASCDWLRVYSALTEVMYLLIGREALVKPKKPDDETGKLIGDCLIPESQVS